MKRRALLSLVLAMALLVVTAVPAGAANPTVTITVSAQVISITNSQPTWTIGVVTAGGDPVYFSADGEADPDYSRITNTGNVPVNIAFQGTNFVAGNTTFNWNLGASADDQIVKIAANTEAAPTVYSVLLKVDNFNNLTTNLIKAATYDWSMEFTPPTAVHEEDDGLNKTATVTLAASKYTP